MGATNAGTRSLQSQFSDALAQLEARFEVLRRFREDDAADPLDVYCAQQAYESARLIWLSCDLQLRSNAVVDLHPLRRSNSILVYSGLEVFRGSLAALLRLQGYETSTAGTLGEVHNALRERPPSAVLAYLEPAMRNDIRFIESLKRAASSRPVVLFHGDLITPAVPAGSATYPVKTISITSLAAELDRIVELAREAGATVNLSEYVWHVERAA